jgi:hypothetical protein
MKDLAKLLGVELDKEFEIESGTNIITAKITDKDFYVLCSAPMHYYNSAAILRALLCGDCTIRRI